MRDGLDLLRVPWLVLLIDSFEGWETLRRRRKQAHLSCISCGTRGKLANGLLSL